MSLLGVAVMACLSKLFHSSKILFAIILFTANIFF